MYATKDNRIQLMERMMDLGCDLTVLNKVSRIFIALFFDSSLKVKLVIKSSTQRVDQPSKFMSHHIYLYRFNNLVTQ